MVPATWVPCPCPSWLPVARLLTLTATTPPLDTKSGSAALMPVSSTATPTPAPVAIGVPDAPFQTSGTSTAASYVVDRCDASTARGSTGASSERYFTPGSLASTGTSNGGTS